jgi:hypothetical protein
MHCVCAAGALALFTLAANGAASAANVGGPDLNVSFSVSKSAVVGEPLVLHYRITNTVPNGWVLRVGSDRTAWLDLDLRGPDGSLPHRQTPRGISPPLDEISRGPLDSLAAGKSLEGDRVLTSEFAVDRAGTLTLSMHVALDYGTSAGALVRTLTGDATRTIAVGPADEETLEAAALLYSNRLIATRNFPQYPVDLDALSSMPDRYRDPQWHRLIARTYLLEYKKVAILHAIARSRSASAVSAVEEALATSRPYSWVHREAAFTMVHIYQWAEPSLRAIMKDRVPAGWPLLQPPPGQSDIEPSRTPHS